MNKKFCVLIPCAGNGVRLNIPFPKELLPIFYGVTLIDNCFELLKDFKDKIRIVIIFSVNKMETIRYLSKYKDEFDIVFKYQNEYEKEMIGAIFSARNLFLEYNLVLFPDTIIQHRNKIKLIRTTLNYLISNKMVFWVKKESNIDILRNEGAVKLEYYNTDFVVKKYVDKPENNLIGLNGFWSAFAFSLNVSENCLMTMGRIINKDQELNFENSILMNSPAIELDHSIDMGIWKAISNYVGSKEYEKSINNYVNL